MNWFNNLKFGILKFSQLKSFKYKIPKDPEKKMYDFYMLTLLRSTGNEYLDYALEETKQTLLPYLKKHLLEIVFFSVCAEFRHAFGGIHMGQVGHLINEGDEKKFQHAYYDYRREYNQNPTILSLPEEYQERALKEKEHKTQKEYIESFIQVVSSMQKSDLSPVEFMRIAKEYLKKETGKKDMEDSLGQILQMDG